MEENRNNVTLEVQVGRRVKALRVLRGYSQRDLAIACGLSNQTLSNIECGKSDFRLSTLRAIENVLQQRLLTIPKEDIFL